MPACAPVRDADPWSFADSKSLDLSYQVDDFKALCTQWKKYEEELKNLVSIGVQHVRR